MNESALLILFCPGFDNDEIQMHEDLIRENTSQIHVESFIIGQAGDIEAAAIRSREFKHVAIWNSYWHVDELSAGIGKAFAGKLVGSKEAITSLTSLKSELHKALLERGLPCLWNACISRTDDLRSLTNVPYPVIVKVDAGYDTIDMSERSICSNFNELETEVQKLLEKHPGVVVQEFLDGREFTIGCANHKVFAPVEKIFEDGLNIYLSGRPYSKKYCDDHSLDERLRKLAREVTRAFQFRRTDYCRIDIRENPKNGELFPIDVNDMCSVHPNSQFDYSLARDGCSRKDLAEWLTSPIRFSELRTDTTIYIPFHSDLSQIENLLPFFRAFRCKVFIYRWSDSAAYMHRYFPEVLGAESFYFDIDTFIGELEKETDNVIVMTSGNLGYAYGNWQKRFFQAAGECYPQLIDVLCVGHCLEHSPCDACKSDVGHIPIKHSAYKKGILTFSLEEIIQKYNINHKTVLVSPTTGDDFILLASMENLIRMKELQDRGICEFLFKLHPSTVMMAFDDIDFQLEKSGYDFVREHFRLVDPEHFSVFPFAEIIRTHVSDLFSSIPAMLTYFGNGILLAKDNPSVPLDHPLRKYLHVFNTSDELEKLLVNRDALDTRNNGLFWASHFDHVSGDEAVSVAFDRKWHEKKRKPSERPACKGKEAFLQRIQVLRTECRELFQKQGLTADEYDHILYYLERF